MHQIWSHSRPAAHWHDPYRLAEVWTEEQGEQPDIRVIAGTTRTPVQMLWPSGATLWWTEEHTNTRAVVQSLAYRFSTKQLEVV